ncbi:5'-3' exonuclease H3TH domain-containing protein, partial [Patescibacteria group bacterium]
MSKINHPPKADPPRAGKTLVLIDSNALIHRGFHALPPTLRNREGKPTNAVYGFTSMLLNAIKELKPDYLIAAFDVDKKTFRHKEYKKYKAHRVKAPDELYEQIPLAEKVLKAFEIPIYKEQGFEADDVVGTLAKLGAEKNLNVLIVTGDLDILQLVNQNIKVFTLKRGFSDTVIYDIEGAKEKLNLRPDQVIDYKALRGDPSDNIPGVKGVGEKTAVNLLNDYQTLEAIFKEVKKQNSKISDKIKEKIIADEKNAVLSQKLAKIVTDLPLDLSLKKSQFGSFDPHKVLELFQELGFRSL